MSSPPFKKKNLKKLQRIILRVRPRLSLRLERSRYERSGPLLETSIFVVGPIEASLLMLVLSKGLHVIWSVLDWPPLD
jgi:hypothetical protein